MRYDRDSWLQRAGSLAIGAAVLLSGASAFAQQLREQVRQAVEERIAEGQAQAKLYWIGVACEPLSPAMRAQLGVAGEQGVLVQDVVADSPAAQAGLKQYDVILTVDDQPIAEPQALARAVAQAQDKELTIRYLRAAKEATVTVKPAPRPAEPMAEEWLVPQVDQEPFKNWLDRFRGPGMGPHPFAMRFFHPGMVLPPGASAEAALPDDMSVTISKHGKAPANIHVERGDKSWDVTEDKLQELPEEIRTPVERMLGRATFAAVAVPEGESLKQGAESPSQREPNPRRPETTLKPDSDRESRLNERMDRIDDQLRRLQEAIDQLRSAAQEEKP